MEGWNTKGAVDAKKVCGRPPIIGHRRSFSAILLSCGRDHPSIHHSPRMFQLNGRRGRLRARALSRGGVVSGLVTPLPARFHRRSPSCARFDRACTHNSYHSGFYA